MAIVNPVVNRLLAERKPLGTKPMRKIECRFNSYQAHHVKGRLRIVGAGLCLFWPARGKGA